MKQLCVLLLLCLCTGTTQAQQIDELIQSVHQSDPLYLYDDSTAFFQADLEPGIVVYTDEYAWVTAIDRHHRIWVDENPDDEQVEVVLMTLNKDQEITGFWCWYGEYLSYIEFFQSGQSIIQQVGDDICPGHRTTGSLYLKKLIHLASKL